MTLTIESEAELIREAAGVLMSHLPPSKFARFWAMWQAGQGDYLRWRDEAFGGRTVDELVAEIQGLEGEDGRLQAAG
jgi:hypothetical protein